MIESLRNDYEFFDRYGNADYNLVIGTLGTEGMHRVFFRNTVALEILQEEISQTIEIRQIK